MSNLFESTELAKHLDPKVVVVEVGNGESRDEAWRRHLLLHPENAAADIKIFHHSNGSSL